MMYMLFYIYIYVEDIWEFRVGAQGKDRWYNMEIVFVMKGDLS